MADLTSIGTILLNDPTFVKNLNKALVQTNANFQRLGTVGLFSGEDGQDASFMKYNLDAIFLPEFIHTLSSDNNLKWDKDICGDIQKANIYTYLKNTFDEENIPSTVPMPKDISEDITSRYDQAYKDMAEWCKIYGKPSEYINKCQEIIKALDTAIRNKYNTLNVLNDVTYNDTKDSSIIYKAIWVSDWYNATKIDDCGTIYRTHVKDYPLGSIQVIENESGAIIGSLPYSFIDPRFNNAHVSQIAAELKSKINVTSLITLHQENDKLIGKILDIIPKIYCDPADGKWKWSINGENTGIPAQGVDGKAGQNGSILILQRLENGITITKGTKDVFIPIIPNSYEGNVEPKDATSIKFKWMDPLVDDNAMINRAVHTATINKMDKTWVLGDESVNVSDASDASNKKKIVTLAEYLDTYSENIFDKKTRIIQDEIVRAICYALWDNVNRTNNYNTNYTGRFRIWKRLTDDSCLYVAGDKDGTFNENNTDAYSPETGYKYGYKIKEGTTDPGQAEITNMDGQACIVFPGSPYDSGEVTGEMRSSFWFGTVHIQRAYPKDKDATCNIATVICDNTNMVRCDLDQNTFAGDMMRLDPYVTEEPDRYGGAQHYPRGLMLPIGSPFMTNDNLSALSKDFSSHILYSDQGGFETLTMRSGSIWRGSFDKESIGDWKPLGDIQGYKKSDKNILHIGSVQDYRGLDYVSTDNIAVPGRMEGSANNNQIISDENDENTYNVRSDHNFQSRVNIDEPTVITSYRDTHNPIYGDKEYPALLTTEGDVVIGAYKHVNNKEYFWKKNDNGDTLDYAATNPFIPQYENGKQTGTYQPVTGDYANPNPDSHRTDDVVNIIDKDAKGDTTKGTMGQGGLWIQGSITKALADRMRVDFFEKSPLRSVIGTTFDIVPQAITRFDTPDAGAVTTVNSIPTGKLPADMVGFSSNVRFSLYADHAIGAQDLIAERSIAVYKQGTYKKINPDKISTKPGDFSFVDKTTYPTFYVGQAGVVVNAEDIYFANNTCIDFSDWHYYKGVKNEKGKIKAVYDVPWEINTPGGNNAVPCMVFGWGIVHISPLHTLEKMRANQDDVAPSAYSVTKGWNPEGIAINDNVTMADGAFSIRHPKVSNLYTPDKNIANRVTFFQGPVDYGENVYGVVGDSKLDSQLKNNRNFNGAMGCITDVYNYNNFTTNHLDFGLTAMWPTADFVVWKNNSKMYPAVSNNHFKSSRAEEWGLRASGIFHSGLFVDGHLYDQDMKYGHYWLGNPYDFAFIVAGNSQLVGDVDITGNLNIGGGSGDNPGGGITGDNIFAKHFIKISKGGGNDPKKNIIYDNSILLGGGLCTVSGPKWRKLTITDKDGKQKTTYVYKKRESIEIKPENAPDTDLELTNDNASYIDPASTDSSKSSDTTTQTPIMIDLGDSFGKKRLMRFNLAKNVKINDNGELSMDPIKNTDEDDQAVLLGRWPGSGWQSSIENGGVYWKPLMCVGLESNKDNEKFFDAKWGETLLAKKSDALIIFDNNAKEMFRNRVFNRDITSIVKNTGPILDNPTSIVTRWNSDICFVEVHIKLDVQTSGSGANGGDRGQYIGINVARRSEGMKHGWQVFHNVMTGIKLPAGTPLPPKGWSGTFGIHGVIQGVTVSARDDYDSDNPGVVFSLRDNGQLWIDTAAAATCLRQMDDDKGPVLSYGTDMKDNNRAFWFNFPPHWLHYKKDANGNIIATDKNESLSTTRTGVNNYFRTLLYGTNANDGEWGWYEMYHDHTYDEFGQAFINEINTISSGNFEKAWRATFRNNKSGDWNNDGRGKNAGLFASNVDNGPRTLTEFRKLLYRGRITDPDDYMCSTEFGPEVVLTFSYPVTRSDVMHAEKYRQDMGGTGGGAGSETTKIPNSYIYYAIGYIGNNNDIVKGTIKSASSGTNLIVNIGLPDSKWKYDDNANTSAYILTEDEIDAAIKTISEDNFKTYSYYAVYMTITVVSGDKDNDKDPGISNMRRFIKGESFKSISFAPAKEGDAYIWDNYKVNPNINGSKYTLTFSPPTLIQTTDTSDYVTMSSKEPNRLTQTIDGSLQAKAFYETSDRRLKDNIEDIDTTTKQKLSNIDFKQFDIDGHHKYGVIAQDIEKQIPAVVSTDKQGYKSVDYISLLCAKISELQDRIEELEKERKKES